MNTAETKLLVCDCEGTMKLDGAALGKARGQELRIHRQLCRGEIDSVRAAAAGPGNCVICCTQETPLFDEVMEEAGQAGTARYVNIRESAGWSAEGGQATAKIAALIAAAQIDAPPARTMTVRSEGRILVYGEGDVAVEAAGRLAGRLDPTLVLIPPGDALPPPVTRMPILRGRVTAVSGAVGGFKVTLDAHASAHPSSSAALAFGTARDGVVIACDIILDLSGGAPLLTGDELCDGYLRPDPGNPAAIAGALFDATDLVGEFEKPIYVNFDETLCAHSRNKITGCTRCLDICPASAITPDGDYVAIDPLICAGCGSCASVCPTGAASYAMPPTTLLATRLRTLLRQFEDAGGTAPVILFHDIKQGEQAISLASRFARGLPARVLPVAVNEVTQLGFDALSAAIAWGAERILILAGSAPGERRDGLAGQVAYVDALLDGLGYDAGRIAIVEERDPEALSERLYALAPLAAIRAASFLPVAGKRALSQMALSHLHDHAPDKVDIVAMPDGAPFGTVTIDTDGCTLCLACVGACPTDALSDNPDAPMLRFTEQACIQCGLCRATCPEKVMTLSPRISFEAAARAAQLLKEEEPFTCVSCGKPFGAKSSVERTIERLVGHPMFAGNDDALQRLRMCEECRVIDHFTDQQPMTGGAVPRTRTTDDYLAERDDEDDDDS